MQGMLFNKHALHSYRPETVLNAPCLGRSNRSEPFLIHAGNRWSSIPTGTGTLANALTFTITPTGALTKANTARGTTSIGSTATGSIATGSIATTVSTEAAMSAFTTVSAEATAGSGCRSQYRTRTNQQDKKN
jgi:hypothetical protein